MDHLFKLLTHGEKASPQTLQLNGRVLEVPEAARGVARFTFSELCDGPLGAEDYLALSAAYHTVFISDIPAMDLGSLNPLRRFITLVDALYESKVKLVCSAERPSTTIFTATNSVENKDKHGDLLGTATYQVKYKDEEFAFDRCASRLSEMQSREYLVKARKLNASAPQGGELFQVFENQGSEEAATKLFEQYDVDASGALEAEEIWLLLEDLSELNMGHRNVTDEEFQVAMERMNACDMGLVRRPDFIKYAQGRYLKQMFVADSP